MGTTEKVRRSQLRAAIDRLCELADETWSYEATDDRIVIVSGEAEPVVAPVEAATAPPAPEPVSPGSSGRGKARSAAQSA